MVTRFDGAAVVYTSLCGIAAGESLSVLGVAAEAAIGDLDQENIGASLCSQSRRCTVCINKMEVMIDV